MNHLPTVILCIIYKLLDKNSNNSLRCCSYYLSKIIGQSYFQNIKVDVSKIINNDYKFGEFVHKNKLSIGVVGVGSIERQMLIFNLIAPSSLTSLTFGNDFNQEIKEHVLLQSLTSLR